MAAVLEAVGAAASGQQHQGIVQQYQKAATASNVDTSTGITGYDSGNIVTTRPGQVSKKLVDGTIQRASQIVSDATAGVVGNALLTTTNAVNGQVEAIPTANAGQITSAGLSGAPERE